ncbi:AtpZ/AtpI family protein [Dendrosporobacter sp. 1207_IL3150]|uniref:AtpZ/AtpI family protein n=1 Tax=Dendrosporobacter sp. 1207_IL3150 TaxID=3084054 RepID=UPI002FDAAF17
MSGKRNNQLQTAFSIAASIGLNMVATLAVGVILGKLLDNWLDTNPWLTVIGIVTGMLAGLWSTYKKIMSSQ